MRISTEFTDNAGVVREVKGIVQPLRAAQNGWSKLSTVYRDKESRVIEKERVA